jgi:DNA-directed RNA polymerase subunit E"
MKKACKMCKRILEKGNICPVCRSSDTTSTFQGVVVIFDVESEIAKKLGITAPGKYAVKV